MVPYVEYRSQRFSTLLLEFDPAEEFRLAVEKLGELHYPSIPVNPDLVSFALLELLSNSIRAHRDRKVLEPVRLDIAVTEEELAFSVIDAGRGFNPALLPYDLNAPPPAVDLMDSNFTEYRERYGGTRFGMGLFVAKKTFPRFSLSFIDREERPCSWFSGSVRGTKIELGIPLTTIETGPGSATEAFLEEIA